MQYSEFLTEFQRLCQGFRYDVTSEQSEAWFRRMGHVTQGVWVESVTTMLCAERFPRDLDAVIKVLDNQSQVSRAKAILREKATAPQIEQGIERNLKEWKDRAGVHQYHPQCDICGGDVHGERLCWPWLDDAERERKTRLPYWQDRRRQRVEGAA